MAHDPNMLVKLTATPSYERAKPFAPIEGVAQRSIADLTDSEADAFGRAAGVNAFLAALESGVGVAVLNNDEISIVSKSATSEV